MKKFLYALFSIPAVCFFLLCLTPGPFSMAQGTWLNWQLKLLEIIAVASPLLTICGIIAIARASLNHFGLKDAILQTLLAFLPGLAVLFLIHPHH